MQHTLCLMTTAELALISNAIQHTVDLALDPGPGQRSDYRRLQSRVFALIDESRFRGDMLEDFDGALSVVLRTCENAADSAVDGANSVRQGVQNLLSIRSELAAQAIESHAARIGEGDRPV